MLSSRTFENIFGAESKQPDERITAGLWELVNFSWENAETPYQGAARANLRDFCKFISMSQSELSRHLADGMPISRELGLGQNASLDKYYMKMADLHQSRIIALCGELDSEDDDEILCVMYRGPASQIDLHDSGIPEIRPKARRRVNKKRKVLRSTPK